MDSDHCLGYICYAQFFGGGLEEWFYCYLQMTAYPTSAVFKISQVRSQPSSLIVIKLIKSSVTIKISQSPETGSTDNFRDTALIEFHIRE